MYALEDQVIGVFLDRSVCLRHQEILFGHDLEVRYTLDQVGAVAYALLPSTIDRQPLVPL